MPHWYLITKREFDSIKESLPKPIETETDRNVVNAIEYTLWSAYGRPSLLQAEPFYSPEQDPTLYYKAVKPPPDIPNFTANPRRTQEVPDLPVCPKCGEAPKYNPNGHRGFKNFTVFHDCPKETGMPTVIWTIENWLAR